MSCNHKYIPACDENGVFRCGHCMKRVKIVHESEEQCEHNTGSPICPKVCQNCLIDYPEKNCTCSCHQEEKDSSKEIDCDWCGERMGVFTWNTKHQLICPKRPKGEKEPNIYKGDMKSVVKKFIDASKEPEPECDGGCVCVCDASAPCNKNHEDCGICKPEEKDYFTKEEEKRFRNDLLKVLNDVVADSNSIKYLCQEYL